jgi:hypothetical protein
MAALSGETIAQIAYQAGFRGQDLINMVAIAKRESSWDPTAHRTDRDPAALSGDRGLFQINYVWDAKLKQAGIISSARDLFDPVVNARAAMFVMQQQGYAAWGVGSGGWVAGGEPLYKTNMTEAARVVQSAQSTGLLGASYSGGGSVTTSTAPTQNTGPITLPSDTKLVANSYGIFAVYDMGGVAIYYDVPWQDGSVQFDPRSVQRISDAEWNKRYPAGSSVHAGSAVELATVKTAFGTYRKMWDSIVGQVMGYNNPAKDDPGVLKVLAEFAGRPDMSEAELQNKLQATKWFQDRTQEELEWNSLSEAERRKRLDEVGARMIGTVFQFQGVDIDANDPRIKNYVQQVASGKLGFGAYTEIIKGQAADMEESPWARQVRDEQEAQRQRPIDIENTAQRIRETAERWGVGWSPATIQDWAKKMVEKEVSDEDLITTLREQAQVLFPWKPPEMETATAAAPWLETYRRVMEAPATINTPEVMQALQAGKAAFDFEVELKKSDKWMQTQNGQDTMYSTIAELGSRMGYV